jgi:hypothetical protein
LPNFGYFQTCWTPWPLPPDWSHCKVPPPAAYVQLQGPQATPGMPNTNRQQPAPPTNAYPSPLPNGNGPVEVVPDNSEQLPRPAPFVPSGPTQGKNGR